ERKTIRGGLVNEPVERHADVQRARDQRLAIHRREHHPPFTLEPDDIYVLLELKLETLRRLRGNGRDLHRKRRATRRRGLRRARLAIFLIALLQKTGIDALRIQRVI